MPSIPYTDDNYVMAGISALWALGFALWVFRNRKRRYTINRYLKGLILTALGLVVCLVVYSGYILARQARENVESLRCHSNLHDLSVMLLQYANDHKNHLPPANEWATDIEPYGKKSYGSDAFHCPSADSPYSYAFNAALGGLSLNSISKPADTVMLFDADAKTMNASGTGTDFVIRHVGRGNVAFADGSIRTVKSSASVNWKP